MTRRLLLLLLPVAALLPLSGAGAAVTIETVQDSDLRAMELIGYDTAPEPGCLALIGFASIALLSRRRRITVRSQREYATSINS